MSHRLILVVFACGALLWTIFAQLNHYLSGWHVNLFVGGLLVTFPALRLSYRDGWKIVVLLGFWCDADAPVRFGLHAVLFLTAYTLIYRLRGRFPREEGLFGLLVAIVANAGIFLALTLALVVRHPAPFSALPPIFLDLFISELFVAVAAGWFFTLQEHALQIAGFSLRRGQRGLL
jgi:rod shape-determining protein MreD